MHVFSNVTCSNSYWNLSRNHVHVGLTFTGDFFCDICHQVRELAELSTEGEPYF